MPGLVNRAIEGFARATYGDALWSAAARAAGADPRGFALMRNYDDALTGNLLRELARRLSRSPRELAEDGLVDQDRTVEVRAAVDHTVADGVDLDAAEGLQPSARRRDRRRQVENRLG